MKKKNLSLLLAILVFSITQLNVFGQSSNSLIGYWPFSGNANDASGNGLHGTVFSATLIADRNGNPNSAYSFDGTSSSIIVAHNQMLNALPLTINFWFKTTQTTAGGNSNTVMFLAKQPAGSNNGYKVGTSQAHRVAPTYCSPTGNCFTSMSWGTDGNWHMATVIYSDTSIVTYVDKIAINTMHLPKFQATTNTNDLLFGKSQHATPFFYDGALDDISFWGKVLTQTEIANLYNGNLVSGIKDISTKVVASIYPNPATDLLTINTKASSNTPYSILDATGRIVSKGKLNSESTTLSIGNLQKGIYMVRIDDTERQQLFKLIKQ